MHSCKYIVLTLKNFSKLASTKFIEQLDLLAIDFKALKWHGLQFLRTWIAEFAAQAIDVIYNGKQKLSQKLLFRFVSIKTKSFIKISDGLVSVISAAITWS